MASIAFEVTSDRKFGLLISYQWLEISQETFPKEYHFLKSNIVQLEDAINWSMFIELCTNLFQNMFQLSQNQSNTVPNE